MMGSIIWTEEEAKYLKTLLEWDPTNVDTKNIEKLDENKPVKNELRVLVVGGKGTGKTSMLQKVSLISIKLFTRHVLLSKILRKFLLRQNTKRIKCCYKLFSPISTASPWLVLE